MPHTDGDRAVFTLTRTGLLDDPLTVHFNVGGTARDDDYAGLARGAQVAVVPSFQSSVIIPINAVDDGDLEGAESVTVTLIADAAYAVGNSGSAEATIIDNEVEVEIIATEDEALENDSTAAGELTLIRRGDLSQSTTVAYAVSGTATSGADYQSLAGTVFFDVDEPHATIVVAALDDSELEGFETVTITIQQDSAYVIGDHVRATVRIADDEATGVIVTVATLDPDASEEGHDPGELMLYRTGSTDDALTVEYAVTGTASTNDYNVDEWYGYAVIPSGFASAPMGLYPVDDRLYEVGETVTLTVVDGDAYDVGSSDSGTITIADNEMRVSVTASADAVESSPGTAGKFDVIREGDLTYGSTVFYSIGGTASAADYQLLTGEVSFDPQQPLATVTIDPIDNAIVDGVKTVQLVLLADSRYLVGDPNQATLALLDDDASTVLVTVDATDPTALEEGQETGALTFYRTGDTTLPLSVTYNLSGSTATSGDYQLSHTTGTIDFGALEDRVTLTISPEEDVEKEGAESFQVTLEDGINYDVGTASSAAVSIIDNDVEVSLSVTDDTAKEGQPADPGQFSITRQGDLTTELSVPFTVSCDADPEKYVGLPDDGLIRFAAGQDTVDLIIYPFDDQIVESGKLLTITLQSGSSYDLDSTTQGSISIGNDDVEIALSASDASAAEGNPADAGSFTFTRTGDLSEDVIVSYLLTGSSADDSDYQETLTGQIQIDSNESSKILTITPDDDGDVEGFEHLTLTLNAGSGYVLGPNRRDSIAITDDDATGTVVTLAATDPDGAEEDQDPLSFTFDRTGDLSSALTVNYQVGGKATAGEDYGESLGGTIEIPAGSSSVTLTITPLEDHWAEADETIQLTLSSGPGYVIGAASTAEAAIVDNEGAITVVANESPAAEGNPGTSGTFTLSRPADVTNELTVYYQVSGTASPDLDYVSITGEVTFEEGSSTTTIAVDPIDDSFLEGTETVTVTLAADQTYYVGTMRSATIPIADDDFSGAGNLPPVATDDVEIVTDVDQVVSIDVLANDVDLESDPLTLSIAMAPANGTASINDQGTPSDLTDDTIDYAPSSAFVGSDTFTYQIADGFGGSDIAAVHVYVNAAPVALADEYSLDEHDTLIVPTGGVLLNDTDNDGDTLLAELVSDVSDGTLTLHPDGTFRYVPTPGFSGQDSFTYKAFDNRLYSSVVTVCLTIDEVNEATVAGSDAHSVDEDTLLVVDAASGLLSNDEDPEGDSLSASLVLEPSDGQLTLNPDGSFTYVPDQDFYGTDTFRYTASDGKLDSMSAQVEITVNRTNNLPTAVNDVVTTPIATAVVIAPLSNDSDVDGQTLTLDWWDDPDNGTVVDNSDGTLTFTPDASFQGVDDFDYLIGDGDNGVAYGTVYVGVGNNAPEANGESYSVTQAFLSVDAASGVLSNDTDADGDDLTVVLVTDVSNGTLTLTSDGSFVYVPDPGFNSQDTFTYKVSDGAAESATVTTTINVDRTNAAPTASADGFSVNEDFTLSIDAAGGVLSNDTDPDGDLLSALLVLGTVNGSLFLAEDGSFEYAPIADFYGTDTFDYVATDGALTSTPVTVTITVNEIFDELKAVADQITVEEDATVTLDLLANDEGVTGSTYIAGLQEEPEDPTSSVAAFERIDDRTISINASLIDQPTQQIIAVINDANGQTSSNTVTVTVQPTNDDPVAVDDAEWTMTDVPLDAINVLENDSDEDGDQLYVDPEETDVSSMAGGVVTVDVELNTIQYVPPPGFSGFDSFNYTVIDGNGGSATAQVTIGILSDTSYASVTAPDPTAVFPDAGVPADTGTFRFARTGPPQGTLTVYYKVSGTAAHHPEINGPDISYLPLLATSRALFGWITFADGESAKNVVITPRARPVRRRTETVTVTLLPYNPYDPPTPVTYVLHGPSTPGLQDDNATITITGDPNTPPVAHDDFGKTGDNAALTIFALSNDNDADGDKLEITEVTVPANSPFQVTIQDGDPDTLLFTPQAGERGEHKFSYKINDGWGGTATAEVTVTVTPPAPKVTHVTVDTKAPELADVPYAKDGVTTEQELTFYGTTEPYTDVYVYLDGKEIGKADVTGTDWTFDYTDHVLPEGLYKLTAAAAMKPSDPDTSAVPDGRSEQSKPFPVRVDLTPPTVTLALIGDDVLHVVANDDWGALPDEMNVTIALLANDLEEVLNPQFAVGALKDGQTFIQIDRSGLDPTKQYGFQATVSDVAGNQGAAKMHRPGRFVIPTKWSLDAHIVKEPLGNVVIRQPIDIDVTPGNFTQAQHVSLVYDSSTVSVRPILQIQTRLPQAFPQEIRLEYFLVPDEKFSLSRLPWSGSVDAIHTNGFQAGELLTYNLDILKTYDKNEQKKFITTSGLYYWGVKIYEGSSFVETTLTGSEYFVVRDTHLNPIAPGWSISTADTLSFEANRHIAVIVNGDNQVELFRNHAEGYWHSLSDPGGYVKWVSTNAPIYLHVASDGSQRIFDNSVLAEWRSRDGSETIKYGYSNGNLSTITTIDGSQASFLHPADRLTSVSAQGGNRVWSLGYVDYPSGQRDLTSVTDPDGGTRTFGYEPTTHRLNSDTLDGGGTLIGPTAKHGVLWIESQPDPGYQRKWQYNNVGFVERLTLGGASTYFYNVEKTELIAQSIKGQVFGTTVQDPLGHVTRHRRQQVPLDDLGSGVPYKAPVPDPKLRIDPDGGRSEWTFGKYAHLQRYRDPHGDEHTYKDTRFTNGAAPLANSYWVYYTSTGQYRQSNVETFYEQKTHHAGTFNGENLGTMYYFVVDTVIDAIGDRNYTTKFAYYADGRLWTTTRITKDQKQETTTYAYYDNDPFRNGLLKSVTDPLTQKTLYFYDDQRRLQNVMYVDGSFELFAYNYNALGHVRAHIDREGRLTVSLYDKMERLDRLELHNGGTILYYYDKSGLLRYTVDQLNRITKQDYNTRRLLTRQTSMYGVDDRNHFYGYDLAGRVSWQQDHYGQKTRYEYDSMARATQVIEADGKRDKRTSTSAYFPGGRLKHTIDPEGLKTHYEYNQSNVLYVEEIVGQRTSNTHRVLRSFFNSGHLEGVLEEIPGQNYPLGTFYSYNHLGAASTVLTSAFDVEEKLSLEYDSLGRLRFKTDSWSTTELKYNDRLNAVRNIEAAGTNLERVSESYSDSLGRDKLLFDPSGHFVEYRYIDQLNTVWMLDSRTTYGNLSTVVKYDLVGREIEVVDPQGVSTSTCFASVESGTTLRLG